MEELPIIKELKDDLKKLEYELRVECPLELRTAAAHGDLSENAEYDAAKQRQTFLLARVGQLSSRITMLSSININDIPRDRAGFGSQISLVDLNTDADVKYELVTPEEVDPRNGKISVSSPIGAALLNKLVGDEVVINLPTGVKEYEVVAIKTLHEVLSAGKG